MSISLAQWLSHVQLFATPRTAAHQGSLSITNSQSLLKLIESVMPSNHLILCRPFSSYLQSFPASGSFLVSQFFASGSQSIGASASASIFPMNIQGWFPLGLTGFGFAVQGILKSLPQHHNMKATVLWHSGFFVVFSIARGKGAKISLGKVNPLLYRVLMFLDRLLHFFEEQFFCSSWSKT